MFWKGRLCWCWCFIHSCRLLFRLLRRMELLGISWSHWAFSQCRYFLRMNDYNVDKKQTKWGRTINKYSIRLRCTVWYREELKQVATDREWLWRKSIIAWSKSFSPVLIRPIAPICCICSFWTLVDINKRVLSAYSYNVYIGDSIGIRTNLELV